MDTLMEGARGRAGDFPGGEAMAELVMGKARKMLAGKPEQEIVHWLGFAGRLAEAVRTGEGFDDLMENGGQGS